MVGRDRSRAPRVILMLVAMLALVAGGCGDDEEAAGGGGGGETTAAETQCAENTGQRATGEPIKLGAIITKQPGIDFSDVANGARAYFDCVNANGGINGRPIEYIVETEQSNPQQIRALATKLVEDENVLALAGNTSALSCSVNHAYYEKHDLYVIVAGVPNECFHTSNIAPVNMGPGYSSLGASQYLIDEKQASSIVVVSPNLPGYEAFNQIALGYARDKGLPTRSRLINVPMTDPAAIALDLASDAGDGGGVVLDFTPPEAIKILTAAERQGLIDRVHWASSTPANDLSVADTLSPAWDGKLGINAELNLLDADNPDMRNYRAVMERYAPATPLGSFSQMGFLVGNIVTDALLGIPEGEDLTRQTVNEAIRDVQNYETGLLCDPWYFQELPAHIPNNTDWTVTPDGDGFRQVQECFDIAAVTPELETVREFERENPEVVGLAGGD